MNCLIFALMVPIVQCFSQPITLKQRNAFPPNFIHSLDSSHMMLTALYCQRKGITFASVHDCFWTHACTVDSMNKVIRTYTLFYDFDYIDLILILIYPLTLLNRSVENSLFRYTRSQS